MLVSGNLKLDSFEQSSLKFRVETVNFTFEWCCTDVVQFSKLYFWRRGLFLLFMIKMAGIWSPRENAIHWISNDSLAKISHNYPYTANTVEPQYNKGWGLAVFAQGVMPLDGIGGLLIQMFVSGVSRAEISWN